MNPSPSKFQPLVILMLTAALVAVVGFWAAERAGGGRVLSSGPGAGSGERFEWKLVTTWPKNLPGLGTACPGARDLSMPSLHTWCTKEASRFGVQLPGRHDPKPLGRESRGTCPA